ncbi:hypothetical protein [Pseudoduganella armeniaca]|uniref:Uncharacterized protein n=1 Tax=Pseudoduganella armeniaca TaxID=2072590 RepID=A0A2R4CB13_9BURK|nr:hypothetical protein [Pseudoduganella armeniaca]AVR96791.1 hypothetical protein C9I28_14745 [Pseudoduganella armeniaca]
MLPLAVLATGSGCAPDNPPSHRIEELDRHVTTDIPASAVTWQIFGTPEYTGGLPGPTDYRTLIAQFRGVPAGWIARQDAPIGRVLVVPEAPRPWLAPGFRQLLADAHGNVVDLIDNRHCHPHIGYLRQSGRPVHGFICAQGGSVLLYLTLTEPVVTNGYD